MNGIIIHSVEINKNPVKTGETFILKVKVLNTFKEFIAPQSGLYLGQENCGQTILQAEILKP